MVRQRVRIRFGKRGDLRWIGHLDLMRCLERAFRRAELPLGFSEGFHPKPRMSFPLALAVGIAGTDEVMELELAEPLTATDVQRRLQARSLPGLTFGAVEVLAPGSKKARVREAAYEVPVPPSRRGGLAERIERLRAADRCEVQRPRRGTPLDVRPALAALECREGVLHVRLRVDRTPGAGPRDVLALLDLADLEQQGAVVTRSAVEIDT